MCKLEVAIGLMAAGLLVAVNEGLSVALGSRRPQWWSMCVWVFKGGLLYLAPSLGGGRTRQSLKEAVFALIALG